MRGRQSFILRIPSVLRRCLSITYTVRGSRAYLCALKAQGMHRRTIGAAQGPTGCDAARGSCLLTMNSDGRHSSPCATSANALRDAVRWIQNEMLMVHSAETGVQAHAWAFSKFHQHKLCRPCFRDAFRLLSHMLSFLYTGFSPRSCSIVSSRRMLLAVCKSRVRKSRLLPTQVLYMRQLQSTRILGYVDLVCKKLRCALCNGYM